MQNSVSIKDLSLSFGAVNVLENLNLDIGDGEFLVLLGSSGCGKSTLLRMIAGLEEISKGEISSLGVRASVSAKAMLSRTFICG